MNENIYDTKVQVLKCKVLKEVSKLAWSNELLEKVLEIPEKIIPGTEQSMRCCVYKERAILSQRIKLAIGGNKNNKRIIQVIKIACEDCPTGGYEVTASCRSCLAHRCAEACRRNAISFGADQKAVIDKEKCIECGSCAAVCPYHAIIDFKRPCESSCSVNAIGKGCDNEAEIDYEKCISCGACAYACPFGAITDRSFILDAVDMLKKSSADIPVYALIAPAIAGQFGNADIGQIISGIKQLGFTDVFEAAAGADVVTDRECDEFLEKGFLFSSCCPAFVSYIEKNFPELKGNISSNLSPMGTLAALLKESKPEAKIIFIGPCTAKKAEYRREEYKGLVDCVLTFEELQALFESKDIDIKKLNLAEASGASPYGRRFAASGGLAAAVSQSLKEKNVDVTFNPLVCSGITECRAALLKTAKKVIKENFVEGMACAGGCVSGAGCLTHSNKNALSVDKFAAASDIPTIGASVDNIVKKV